MTPQNTASVFALIANSGPVAIAVLLLLLGSSLLCWGIIFAKWKALGRAARENRLFLDTFRAGKNLAEVYSKSAAFSRSPLAIVFRSGVTELNALSSTDPKLGPDGLANIQRALLRSSSQQISDFERYVSVLATVASAAPFVGLFGTVWGIMNAFQNIGATGAANLAVVAPGISEALITTATGIAAAIPAVVAYNAFAGSIRKLAGELDNFSQDFLNIVQRGVLGTPGSK